MNHTDFYARSFIINDWDWGSGQPKNALVQKIRLQPLSPPLVWVVSDLGRKQDSAIAVSHLQPTQSSPPTTWPAADTTHCVLYCSFHATMLKIQNSTLVRTRSSVAWFLFFPSHILESVVLVQLVIILYLHILCISALCNGKIGY